MCCVKLLLCVFIIVVCNYGYSVQDALPIKDLKNTPCAPTDSFVLECNTCYCNGQGTGYLCTEKICPVIDQTSTVVANTSSPGDNTTHSVATTPSVTSSTAASITFSTTPLTASSTTVSTTPSTTVTNVTGEVQSSSDRPSE
ncbi:G8 domain-containing protein DDB_G0286311 isoform X2 [Agrilus planipennis]|uniref:G8 domain-containing protein DDB_G0286311 isoform X2 n=1 Tax=Agrilus planipennis TaxID=224129 RepID=A0A1W4XQY5_AGRPL|nr:G8 domain-containing protein DDB_G0286311 isoform X2 [Agrilus planipennis]